MTERNDRSGERRSAEGVRIIGADEAQAALEAGQVAGRLTEEDLRYGDVPPAPAGPRPAHRFPLPDSVPAEAVPRPPIAPVARPAVVRAPRASEAARSGRAGSRADDLPDERAQAAAETGPGAEGTADSVVTVRRPAAGSDLPEGSRPERGGGVSRPGSRGAAGAGVEPGDGDPDEIDLDAADPRDGPGLPARPAPASPGDPRPRQQRPRARTAPPPPPFDEVVEETDRERRAPSLPPVPGGDTPAGVFGEADPTGRVPVFDPGLPGPELPGPAGSGPAGDLGADDTVATFGAPLAEEPPTLAPPGSGLRWATRPEEDPPSGGTWSEAGGWAAAGAPARGAEPPAPTGDDPWDLRAAPDEPTAVHPAATAEPAHADDGERYADLGERGSDLRGWYPPPSGGITVWGGGDLPHWTEPPTGEVPTSLTGLGPDDPVIGTGGGARWRRGHEDWDDAPAVGDLVGDDLPLGALDQDRSEESDLFSFDEDFERLEAERTGVHAALHPDDLAPADPYDPDAPDAPVASDAFDAPDETGEQHEGLVGAGIGTARQRAGRASARSGPLPADGRGVPARPAGARRRAPGSGSDASLARPDLSSRLGVGLGLAVVLIVAYALGAEALLALVTLGLLGAAAEGLTMLRESSGFRPATLVGLLATFGLVVGAWWKGEAALPLVLAVATVATMLWYLLGVSDARPLANVMATLTVVVWVGLLGSFAGLLLRAPHGRGLLFAAVVTVVLADVVAYFGGRSFGRRKLAPRVSPGKTVEGFLAGGVAALVVGGVVGHLVPGWGGVGHGLLLGLVVAVFAPIGDLFESLIKRDLDIKDSGRLLAGHGGLLDRFDSVILVLPAVYYLAVAMHLA